MKWTKSDVVDHFGLTLRRVNQLFKDGVLFGNDSIKLCRTYLKFKSKSLDPNIEAQKLRYQTARAEMQELITLEKKGSLISKQEALFWIMTAINEARMAFDSLPRRLCETLTLENDPKMVEVILREEIRSILRQLAHVVEEKEIEYEKGNINSQGNFKVLGAYS